MRVELIIIRIEEGNPKKKKKKKRSNKNNNKNKTTNTENKRRRNKPTSKLIHTEQSAQLTMFVAFVRGLGM